MKTSEITGYFAYWSARDYAETPRRIRGGHLFLSTACNRQCPECAANIPAIRYPEQYPPTYFQEAADYFRGIEHVSITGGEPTLHPQWRDDIKIYGLDLDSWMGRQAEIVVNLIQGGGDLVIMVESAAPVERHPLTLTFEHPAFHAPQTHIISLPGLSLARVDLRRLPAQSTAEKITLSCDQTFIPSEITADCQESRELGCGYVHCDMNGTRNSDTENSSKLAFCKSLRRKIKN